MIDWMEIIARIGTAAIAGCALGLNRHLHHKATGVRTLGLVASGAAALVLAALHGADGALHVEAMSRVVQGILTGLGFIGAGVIIHDAATERVHGITTAATVWATAIIGTLCGIGAWRITLALGCVVGAVLLVGGPIERWCQARFGGPDDPDN
jgi:putative Mg2+ transporter-C (MgtC) family protein